VEAQARKSKAILLQNHGPITGGATLADAAALAEELEEQAKLYFLLGERGRHLSEQITRATRMHLVPAEGPLPYRVFYTYIGQRGFPVTQFIRHGSHPEFTPEPDMIHDCLGHVPPLMNQDYAELLTLIGKAAATTPRGDQVLALKRFSWFSIEFGLIEERAGTKVFGAGILSSTGEIPNALFSKDVTRRPFVADEVIAQDYDPSQMQVNLFVAPSFPFLRAELTALVARLGIVI
jgi:phenylalanine-4-hydroxylase